ncbi:MAG TPA: hypothetical protein VFE98_08865 [Candidatus Bathyarchaeia archaeon]|nr:hypothetical protein [Candidatus Bathyarchaeia archaeon]
MPTRAVQVKGTPEFIKMYSSFSCSLSGKRPRGWTGQAEAEHHGGEQIQKRQWPPLYVKRDGIQNLWKFNLSRVARLVYTIVSEGNGYSVLVLEAFLNHKEYSKRFGYS